MNSRRALQPFIPVNCAAIPKDLIESELFGHEKGAFTGAASHKTGKFQAANGGTIFLDEIGELPFSLQATLLRVLQDKIVTPVGSNAEKKLDVRIISATNAPLEEMVEQKLFRRDLYHRLNVLPITLKPLRERPEDIPILVQAFLAKANLDEGTRKQILDETVEGFKNRPWRGNVRELEHAIQYLVTVSPDIFLDETLITSKSQPSFEPKAAHKDLDSIQFSKRNEEKALIIAAIEKEKTVSGAARWLNLSRSTLRDKMKIYGIEIEKPIQEANA